MYTLIYNIFRLSSSSNHKSSLRADIHAHQNIPFPEFQVASSMATIHWPQSPWQQASALLTRFFFTDQFPFCLMCLSLCISLSISQLPPPFSKMQHFPLICVLLYLPGRKSGRTQQPADKIFVMDRLVCNSGELAAEVGPVVHLQSTLPQAKCPWVAQRSIKAAKAPACWSLSIMHYRHKRLYW